MRYLDVLALAKLKNLHLSIRHYRAEGHLAGRHRSIHHGFSQEFAQHREYAPGDELKHLDWKVYARKDRYFVKQFQEDKSLQTYILVDSSGSMSYRGSGALSKWEYACYLAMGMGYLVLHEGDAAGLVTFNTVPGTFIPPRRQITHLELIDSALSGIKPQGETDLAQVLRRTLGLISRRSLIILISDLMGDAERILEVLKTLHARKHEVFILQVLDPTERELDIEGPVRFESLETKDFLRCEAAMVRQAYREEFNKQLKMYKSGFHQSAIPYTAVYTDAAWEKSLAQFLALQRLVQ